MWTNDDLKTLYHLKHDQNRDFAEIARILKTNYKRIYRKYRDVDWKYFVKHGKEKEKSRKYWSDMEVKTLYELKEKGYNNREIADAMDKTLSMVKCKLSITNKEQQLSEEDGKIDMKYMIWKDPEIFQLYDLKHNKKLLFSEIAKIIKTHALNSCRLKYERTDWEKFFKDHKKPKKEELSQALSKEELDEQYVDRLTKLLIETSRHDPERLITITKNQFYEHVNVPNHSIPISFTELKKKALYSLEQIGYCYPSSKKLAKGTYIVVGDTHGKHTRSGIFRLIHTLYDYIEADGIIHIGHMLDDDNDVNYHWDGFDKLTVLAREEELKFLSKETKEVTSVEKRYKDIVRKEVQLGKLSIQNQDLITDYVQTFIGSVITSDYFENSTIVNLHRHELDTRCTEEGNTSIIASPGCLCEKHIVYTIKQQDFTDGRTVKQTFPVGYKKYRRMQHMYKKWEQGILVVHVNGCGDFTIIQCPISKTSKGFTTSYFDKIISEDDVIEPDLKGFVHGDLHIDKHDISTLDIQEQFCKNYRPDYVMNVGDIMNNFPLNHYEFQNRGTMYIEKDVLKEASVTNYILRRIRSWADKMYLMKGNHERFARDFINRFPQFATLLNFEFLTGTRFLDIEVTDLKKIKKVGNANFIHGELSMLKFKKDRLDQMRRIFGRNCIMGHCHYPSTRSGCHTVGLSGLLDQEYNETIATKWLPGFAYCNTFEDQAFICNVPIINSKFVISHKTYTPRRLDNWKFNNYNVSLKYKFEKKNDQNK